MSAENRGRVNLAVRMPRVVARLDSEPPKRTAWHRFVDFLRCAERALPAVLVVLIAIWALFGSDQGKDILRAAAGNFWLTFKLATAVTVIAIVGATCIVFLASLGADLSGEQREAGRGIATLGVSWLLAIAWFVLFWVLAPPGSRIQALLLILPGFVGLVTYQLVLPSVVTPMFWRALEHPGWVTLFSFLTLVLVAIFPSQIGAALGSALTLAATASVWLMLVTAFAARRRAHKVPLLGVIFLGLAFFLISQFFADKDVIRGEPRFRPGSKFDVAYDEWRQRQPEGAPVIVFVAAAGGGVRASYWTSLILARATYSAPSLRHQMFLASGVSGGSLGLAVYRALLTGPHAGCVSLEQCASAFHRHDFLAGILGATLTSSAFNALLPVNLFPPRSHALEKAWEAAWRKTVNGGSGTRNTNEFADPFEDLWRSPGPSLVLNATSSTGGDRIAISNLSTDWLHTRGPCKANIAEHLRLPLSAAVNASARFPLLEDWGSFTPQQDSRISQKGAEAAQSDSGQPGVSLQESQPASGHPNDPPPADKPDSCHNGEAVADGGFIDNYGAATIYDALDALERTLKDRPADEARPRVIVVQITSDPDCRIADALDPDSGLAASCEEQLDKRRQAAKMPSLGASFQAQWTQFREIWLSGRGFNSEFWREGDEFWQKTSWLTERLLFYDPSGSDNPGVLGVLSNARTVSGLNVASSLRCKVIKSRGSYYHFSMAGAFDSPLGWALSARALDQLKGMLEGEADAQNKSSANAANAQNMKSLINELISGKPTVSVPAQCN